MYNNPENDSVFTIGTNVVWENIYKQREPLPYNNNIPFHDDRFLYLTYGTYFYLYIYTEVSQLDVITAKNIICICRTLSRNTPRKI